ncbi:V-type proton ATPase 16 kDa proteolipid subunit [Cyclospora cayetanensis]|uniref:V-type proton ATPase 16 kDa proteolipid subunit n=2 Tax=Cyclospora cayetanensis TaxID=88456 RepID=A0A6P5WDB6_9EIME|nr:V-type proton ATPase 16 kDa proteolipid subunit [Cyclospora cayetanensis]OEH77252.1 vacuolar ATP synthase 16 kda proteolipid [Cyclospora cayetanensis]
MFWSAALQCDPNSVFFGFMGITSAIVFANLGAAYGTAKSGVGVSSVGVMRPDLIMRSILPVIMAGILGIYGLIISIVISSVMGSPDVYSAYAGYGHLAGGLAVGLSSLAAGLAIGIVGDAGVRANAQQPKLFFGVTLILIFAEAIGLYGLIIALVIVTRKVDGLCTSYKS